MKFFNFKISSKISAKFGTVFRVSLFFIILPFRVLRNFLGTMDGADQVRNILDKSC